MNNPIHEQLSLTDKELPIIFHKDKLAKKNDVVYIHWHEEIEILYVTYGEGVICDGISRYNVSSGDIVIIHSNNLHRMYPTSDHFDYYCLIPGDLFYDELSTKPCNIKIKNVIQDEASASYLNSIIYEMENQNSFYKAKVKAVIIEFIVHITRNFSMENPALANVADKKSELVKNAITYIKSNYLNQISTSDICKSIGISEHYFCHTFKQHTGKTALEYMNYLRCMFAKKLLETGKYNVSEAAQKSGFNYTSYFTQTYKKHIGSLPSKYI